MPKVNSRPVPQLPKPPSASGNTARAPAPKAPSAWGTTGRSAAKPALLKPATLQTPATVERGDVKLPSNVIAGVPVKAAKELEFQGLTGANPLMTRTTEVRFGRLNQGQFDALKAEFGGKSQVKFDPNREYTAVDFLPPSLQALVNRDVDPGESVKLPGTARLNAAMGNEGRGDIELNASPNCHGTAWEAMRSFQGENGTHVALLYGDAQLADANYATADRFKTLGTAAPGTTPAFLSELKAGDVVTFKRGEYDLLHSAVYAGGGLFFEKPNTESDTYEESPYRLVTYEQVVSPITDFLGEAPSAVALRPNTPLPAGIVAFGAEEDGSKLEAWAAKNGKTLGKPLVRELEVGMGGGIRGSHLNAVDTKRVEIGADGRGVIR